MLCRGQLTSLEHPTLTLIWVLPRNPVTSIMLYSSLRLKILVILALTTSRDCRGTRDGTLPAVGCVFAKARLCAATLETHP